MSETISNIPAECALLGACMIDNRLIEKAADRVAADEFYSPIVGRAWNRVVQLYSLNKAVNPVTLLPFMEEDPDFEAVGGRAWLADLTGGGAILVGALDFADQIHDLAGKRRFAEAMFQCAVQCESADRTIEELAAIAEGAIADALRTEGGGQSMSASKAMEANLDQQFEDSPGIVCRNIPSLDHALGALYPGDLCIVAGRPGMGKTALALSYGHGVAEQGHGVTFASLEMRAAQLGGRLACSFLYGTAGQVPYSAISQNKCTVEQRRNVGRAALAMREMPLWIEDLPASTVGHLGAIVRRHKRRLAARGKQLRLVIVDYLQLLAPDGRAKNLYEATSLVSRGLKSLAKAEGVAVMALCQLSRGVEQRENKRPSLHDLRDSGQIEQDADSICFLLRQEEYLKRTEPHPDSPEWPSWRQSFEAVRGKAEFIVAKRRNGETGIGHGLWHGEFQAVRG